MSQKRFSILFIFLKMSGVEHLIVMDMNYRYESSFTYYATTGLTLASCLLSFRLKNSWTYVTKKVFHTIYLSENIWC